MHTAHRILAGIPILTAVCFAPAAAAPAQAMSLGEASNYVLLGLNNGTVRAETDGIVAGDFGYSAGVVSTANSKIGSAYIGQWTGTAYVHSAVANFACAASFLPTGGIVTNLLESQRLDRANADALAHSQWAGSLPATQTLGALTASITLGSVDGLRTVHIIEVTKLDLSGRVLQLVGDAVDVFVINVRGSFHFAESEVKLTGGITADHVLFNLPPGGNYTKDNAVHKRSIFRGTILAPALGTRKFLIHDRTTLHGALICKRIEAHDHVSLLRAAFTATVCPCTGPAASVTDSLPSCNTGMDPVLTSTRPVISTTAQTHISSQSPSSLVLLLASFGEPTPLVFPGTTCTIYVDLLDAVTLQAGLTDGSGGWSHGIPIPAVCNFVGLQLALQAGILDEQVAGPIPGWVSNGVRMTVGL